MKKRYYIQYITVVSILLIIFIDIRESFYKDRKVVLEFGMFTGSNWNVQNADIFVMIDKAIERFEEKHPDVKVTYKSGIDKKDYSEWCAKKLLVGKLPDVFMILTSDFNNYCSLGVLQELDLFIENDKTFDKDKFFETVLETGKGFNDDLKQYALPYEVVPTLLFVNKTLLDNEGIELPNKDWTWDDFYEICNKVTKDKNGDGRIDQFGTYNYTWLNAVNTSGGNFFNDETKKFDFTNENVLHSIGFMKKLNALNKGESVTKDDFNVGNVAFMPLTFAEYITYKTYPYKIKRYTNFKWDCITFPARIKGKNLSKIETLLIAMNKNSNKKEIAWEFLKELTYNKESQMDIFRYSKGVSVLKDVVKSREAETIIKDNMDKEETVISSEILYDVIQNGVIRPKFCSYNQYEQIITLANNQINEIFEKEENIESSMKIFQRKLNQYLNK